MTSSPLGVQEEKEVVVTQAIQVLDKFEFDARADRKNGANGDSDYEERDILIRKAFRASDGKRTLYIIHNMHYL